MVKSVTGDQIGTQQAQVTAPANPSFGIQPVSSPPNTGLTREDLEKEVRRAESRIGMEWRKRLDEAELKAITDPEETRVIRAAQEARRREDEANQKLADATEAETRAQTALSNALIIEARATAKELAAKYQVDSNLLLQFTEGKMDKMEDLAKLLPKVQPGQPNPSNPPTIPFRPDSGQTLGGGNLPLEALLKQDTRRMTPVELREHKRLIEAHARGMPR